MRFTEADQGPTLVCGRLDKEARCQEGPQHQACGCGFRQKRVIPVIQS